MPAAENEGCLIANFCTQYSRCITHTLQLLGPLHVRPYRRRPK